MAREGAPKNKKTDSDEIVELDERSRSILIILADKFVLDNFKNVKMKWVTLF